MSERAVVTLLEAAFPGAEISVALEGSHCSVRVVAEEFAGMRSVARQQRVYAPLADLIADGTLHAVNIAALTPAEAGS